MMKSLLRAAALCLAVASSCVPKGVEMRPTIQYVRDVIDNADLRENAVVGGYNPDADFGTVCVIGTPADCDAFSAMMARCDLLDNVTGREHPDGLPDFSGEMITSVSDEDVAGMSPDSLRERTVRDVVSALDTVYYLSEFDKVGLGKRPSAKLVVLASPQMSSFGKFDADTLFSAFGKASPVVSPLELMVDKAFAASQGPACIGIICDTAGVREDAIRAAFEDAVKYRGGDKGSSLYIGPVPADSTGRLKAYLNSYLAAGNSQPLGALLVVGTEVPLQELRSELASIRVPLSDDFLAYDSVLTHSFEILSDRQTAALECLRILRATNRFTHNIHYPLTTGLKTVVSEDGSIILTTDVQKQH